MKKTRRIKFEDKYNERLEAGNVIIFDTADEAGEAARKEAEEAGVAPGAVMHVSHEGAVTGVYAEEKAAGIIDAVYEPGDVIGDEEAFEGGSDADESTEGGDSSAQEGSDDGDNDTSDVDEVDDEFAGLTKDELTDRAREAEIQGFSTMNKAELLEALRSNS